MSNEMIICIPGVWKSRKDLIEATAASTKGEYIFIGGVLFHPPGKDQVELEFCEPDHQMARAFEIAGQGKLSKETLSKIKDHKSVVYVYFSLDILSQRPRLMKFTDALSRCGGIALKLENSGIAHEWERWFSLVGSDNPFDAYCASVVLIGDETHYYSSGMQCFGLPDAQISKDLDSGSAAELLNQFNYWRIVEKPNLDSGHTFSLTPDSSYFRVNSIADRRHHNDDLFHNRHGLWDLKQV